MKSLKKGTFFFFFLFPAEDHASDREKAIWHKHHNCHLSKIIQFTLVTINLLNLHCFFCVCLFGLDDTIGVSSNSDQHLRTLRELLIFWIMLDSNWKNLTFAETNCYWCCALYLWCLLVVDAFSRLKRSTTGKWAQTAAMPVEVSRVFMLGLRMHICTFNYPKERKHFRSQLVS